MLPPSKVERIKHKLRAGFVKCVSVILLFGFKYNSRLREHVAFKLLQSEYLHIGMVSFIMEQDYSAKAADFKLLLGNRIILMNGAVFRQVYEKSLRNLKSSPAPKTEEQARVSLSFVLANLVKDRLMQGQDGNVFLMSIETLLVILQQQEEYPVKALEKASRKARIQFEEEILTWVNSNAPDLSGVPLSWVLKTLDLYI